MPSSEFSNNQLQFEGLEQVDTHGATCDTYRVKLYGKLHFLKRLKAEHVHDIRYQEALRKEFETGYRLEHPNLVRYISRTEDGILMEYIDGETLTQRLANHPDYFSKRKNREKFVSQLLDVVGYLHSHQVLHLDLKPDNILLTRINDDVKLIDFGFCYTDSFVDTQGYTEAFAAPEQRSTVNGQLSTKTDIYAIGKILEQLPDHHIYNKVIARCTAESPEDRYQSIEELEKAVKPAHRFFPVILLVIIVGLIIVLFISRQKDNDIMVTTTDSVSAEPADTFVSSPQQPEIALSKTVENLAPSKEPEITINQDHIQDVSPHPEQIDEQQSEIRKITLAIIQPIYQRKIDPVVKRVLQGDYDDRHLYISDSLAKVFVIANEEVHAELRKKKLESRFPDISEEDLNGEIFNAIGDAMHFYSQKKEQHFYPNIKLPPDPFKQALP